MGVVESQMIKNLYTCKHITHAHEHIYIYSENMHKWQSKWGKMLTRDDPR